MAKFVPPVLRAYLSYDPDEASNAAGLACDDVSRTRQADAKDADINTIVKNFGLTGTVPAGVRVPTYGDFDFVGDYRSAIEAIRSADASFMAMPADVRSRFDNDPARFVDFCSDPANVDELRKLGLAVPAPETPPPPPAA